MMVCRAGLSSDTLARKAQRILTSHGYHCEIIRMTGNKEGCSIGVRVAGNCEETAALLRKAGIAPRSLTTERDSP